MSMVLVIVGDSTICPKTIAYTSVFYHFYDLQHGSLKAVSPRKLVRAHGMLVRFKTAANILMFGLLVHLIREARIAAKSMMCDCQSA